MLHYCYPNTNKDEMLIATRWTRKKILQNSIHLMKRKRKNKFTITKQVVKSKIVQPKDAYP